MNNANKLTGKDLINVGIYSAMTLVIFFVVGLLTALPVVYPFLFLIWPIVCGIPMMLYYTKSGNLECLPLPALLVVFSSTSLVMGGLVCSAGFSAAFWVM